MATPGSRGFTLIELLVVVTVIVLLIALLAPALDSAIYRAELTVCATQLRGIGTGATLYANAYKRYYPHRSLDPDRINPGNGRPHYYDQPSEIKYHPAVQERPIDQRPVLREAFIDLSKQLNDPLAGQVDLNADAEVVFASYDLWWGFTFYNPAGMKTMRKIGEYWTYGPRVLINGQMYPQPDKFHVLAGDRDLVRPGVDAQCGHADDVYGPGLLVPRVFQNEQGPWLIAPGRMTISLWYSSTEEYALNLTDHRRGALDSNFVMSDLSVAQVNKIHWDAGEERGRMRIVSTYSSGWQGGDYSYRYVP